MSENTSNTLKLNQENADLSHHKVEPIYKDQAHYLSVAQRLELFLSFNNMDEPIAYGIISVAKNGFSPVPYWVNDLKNKHGSYIYYPVIGDRSRPSIALRKLPVNSRLGDMVSLQFRLASDKSEVFQKKPFAIHANTDDMTVVDIIPKQFAVFQGDNIVLPKSLLAYSESLISQDVELLKEKINRDKELHEKAIKNQAEELKKHYEQNSSHHREEYKILLNTITELKMEKSELEMTVASRMGVAFDLDDFIRDAERKKELLMSEYNRLREYAKQSSNRLMRFDLITEQQNKLFSGETVLQEQDGEALEWFADLQGDYRRLVNVIQAYLFRTGIIYPRMIIANFLTLLRTNDIIILSGLSGAGKTQLVRSFARALCGVAHIIPVKPNWTGSEDLLGYFNPLQRSYVRTHFLEALLEAERDPNRLHLICLDEMNLARAEYYFADFLSVLEDRSEFAEVHLYSDSEASHIFSEVRMLMNVLEQFDSTDQMTLQDVLKSKEAKDHLQSVFGDNASESFPAFHSRLRRMMTTVLDVPARVAIPPNVRFIGAINVDQTTYGLSPKILDRAHLIRFENPLKYDLKSIENEVSVGHESELRVAPVRMHPSEFTPVRSAYPDYKANHPAAEWLQHLYEEYLMVLGMDIAYRTIRQAQHYWDLLADALSDDQDHQAVAKNMIITQKIMPKFTLDGKTKVQVTGKPDRVERFDIVKNMADDLKAVSEESGLTQNVHAELKRILNAAESSDKIFNYWA